MRIQIEGNASIALNSIVVICAHCNHHERENALIEFNARENKILFLCNSCKTMNEIRFGPSPEEVIAPLPRTRIGR
jgi:hypothetical protein